MEAVDRLLLVSNTVREARRVSTQGVCKCAPLAAEAILEAA